MLLVIMLCMLIYSSSQQAKDIVKHLNISHLS